MNNRKKARTAEMDSRTLNRYPGNSICLTLFPPGTKIMAILLELNEPAPFYINDKGQF
jgi:hypothetical protein